MNYTLFEQVKEVLGKDERLVADGELLRNRIIELARKNDALLLKHLLADSQVREAFFTDVEGVQVFDSERFVRFINNKEFLPDSYTAFKNKIGLAEGDDFVSQNKNVVLNWPYKDCVLEGGQTKEDAKRDEVFWNETLAPDQIHRLLDPKVFTDWKSIDAKGEHKLEGFKTDENGDIKDNLIIKGNNLLALHSLKARFASKVKLIYIDPPYNPDNQNNTFTYNNTFKHSTWLTFMRNRLEIAKDLLRDDGVLQVAIDENEQEYLGVLISDIFKDYEKHCITIVHNPRGVQGDNFSYTHEYVYFVFRKGLKPINKIKRDPPIEEELRKHGGESLRNTAKNCFYPILVKNDKIVGFGDVPKDSYHPKQKNILRKDGITEVWPIDAEGVERKWVFALQSVEQIRKKLSVRLKHTGEVDIFRLKDDMVPRTVWIGERYDASTFGSKIVNKVIDGKTVSFPKSLYAVYDCIYSIVKNDKEAIVLDFFAGSGTTAHAVLDLNKEDGGRRQFILIEQIEEHVLVANERIRQEISKSDVAVSFVYVELMPLNQIYVDKVKGAKSEKELAKVWSEIQEKGFLSYKLNLKDFDANAKEFAALSLVDQKRFILESLDYNQLYVNYSEMEDKDYAVPPVDKKLNKEFYGK